MKKLMTGNEAIALGAYEGGCEIAAGYAGTPSTEILENLAKYKEVYSQWSPNEKVATEIVCGASAAGARSIATMKVVGLNVAMDPFMNFSYMGVNGGMVLVVADDPGCSSSQTEQDNRRIAPFAKIPMLEPSNSQECKEFMKLGFEISENFDIPLLYRVTTRVCHSKSIVEVGKREVNPIKEYEKTSKYVASPTLARKNHARIEEVLIKLKEYANECPVNKVEMNNTRIGIITSGMSYNHAKEVFGDDASYLKLGLTHPLPNKLIEEFSKKVDTLYVIEENEPYIEEGVKLLGIPCIGKEKLPILYELTPEIIKKSLLDENIKPAYEIENVANPSRPPVLCAGCPHRSMFFEVSKYKDIVAANDIGCYTLGAVPPLGVTDTIFCMGAGITAGLGFEKVFAKTGQNKKVFGFMGDSTFFHSGITGLIDAVWNKSAMTICILDNRTTAMTGHQENPGTGKTLMGNEAPTIDILTIVKAVGVKEENIRVVDAYDLKAVEEAVKAGYESTEPFVILALRPCALIKEIQKERAHLKCEINQEKCKKCKKCMKIGCPAVILKDSVVSIDTANCNGCTMCKQVCPFDAIERVGE